MPAAPPPPAPGDRLAPFALPIYPGGAAYRYRPGHITVVSFCAFWCDTWKGQSARLAATLRSLEGLPLELLTISIDGRWAELGRDRVPGRVLLDAGAAYSHAQGIRAVPYTVLLDRTGTVRWAAQGVARSDTIRPLLQQLITGEADTASGAAASPIYLTFDDFPAGPEDDDLLDILRAHGVRATLFCIGRNLKTHAALARRAAQEGHSMQMHSWDHIPGAAADPQMERTARVLEEITEGPPPSLYRLPGQERVYRWPSRRPLEGRQATVNPYDYQRPGEAELSRRVLLATRPSAVILLHAGVAETRRALPGILVALKRRRLTPQVLP